MTKKTTIKPWHKWVIGGLVLFFFWAGHVATYKPKRGGSKYPEVSAAKLLASGSSTTDAEIVKHLELTPKFEFRRYCIQASPNETVHRTSVNQIPEDFFATGRDSLSEQTTLSSKGQVLDECIRAIDVDVPEFRNSEAKTESLLLGGATTLSRLRASLPGFSRWLSNSNTVLVIMIADRSDFEDVMDEIRAVQTEAENLAIKLKLKPCPNIDEHMALRRLGMSQMLLEEAQPDTKWVGLIDDDTFVVSLPDLVNSLSRFDPSLPWYIGGISEGLTNLAKVGYMALGGAGIFLSVPLLEQVVDNLDGCRSRNQNHGDLIWSDCILRYTDTHLTRLPGLNQLDLFKDASGFYESGQTQLLTVHHWKSWHWHPIPMSHLVADVAGPDTFLQRYQFDGNTVFTNGYSIINYPGEMPNLHHMELTMSKSKRPKKIPGPKEFAHSFGTTRPELKEGTEKVSWRFEYAVKGEDGTIRQFYVKRHPRRRRGTDSVIEVDWK